MQLEAVIYITNQQLGCICFLYYIKDILLGKYEYYSLSNVYIIRYSLLLKSNLIKKISNFKTFSDEYKGFTMYYGLDFIRNI